jgi:NAD+ synthase
MEKRSTFGPETLRLDTAAETARIVEGLRTYLRRARRRGFVLGVSGGIDSSVCAALGVAAAGKERVLALLMSERESGPDTPRLSRLLVDSLGIESVIEDISGVLDAAGCYRRRDDAIRLVYPGFGPGYRAKIVLPGVLESDSFRLFTLVVLTPDGREERVRLSPEAYLGIVAATNFKQRVRKMIEYHHADRLNYAVIGTPNRLEYDQGFFVKNGDGAADVKPIAHLYKSQVYHLASALGIPGEIQSRPPTTDTYSMPQSQEEFYFSLPYDRMDLCLYGKNNGIPVEAVAAAAGITMEQVGRVYRDIDQKRRSTGYLHERPVLMAEVTEV